MSLVFVFLRGEGDVHGYYDCLADLEFIGIVNGRSGRLLSSPGRISGTWLGRAWAGCTRGSVCLCSFFSFSFPFFHTLVGHGRASLIQLKTARKKAIN